MNYENTKILLPVILFAFLAYGNVNAQSASVKIFDFNVTIWDDYSPELGVLTGTGTLHLVFMCDKAGNEIGLKANSRFTDLTSSTTSEMFTANVVQQNHNITSDVIISKMKIVLKGNMGTRMVCDETIEFNLITGDYVSLEHNHKQWENHKKLW